jgi:RHS repeat-associated protein
MSTACLPASPESTRVKSRDGPLNAARYRNYHPTLGRWIERDPAGYVAGANLYAYCSAGPASAVDPTGLSPFGGIDRVPVDPGLVPTAPLGGLTGEPNPPLDIPDFGSPFDDPWAGRPRVPGADAEREDTLATIFDFTGRVIRSWSDGGNEFCSASLWALMWGLGGLGEALEKTPHTPLPEDVEFIRWLLECLSSWCNGRAEESERGMDYYRDDLLRTWRAPWGVWQRCRPQGGMAPIPPATQDGILPFPLAPPEIPQIITPAMSDDPVRKVHLL